MSADKVICPKCRFENDYSKAYCRCGGELGFPNRRDAEEQAAELDERYNEAFARASARGIDVLVEELERLASSSTPVICMSIEAADDITRDGKYKNYHIRVEQGERVLASRVDESDRTNVGSRMYPGYFSKIHYAALSSDGRGLDSYGDVACSWRVEANYLEKRISVHEENSYVFYENHSLGVVGAEVPRGYAGVWSTRKEVVVAKLEPRLNATLLPTSLPDMLVHDGSSRASDDFVEVAIYADDGIDTLDLECVSVQNRPTDREKQQRLELIEATCRGRGIAFFH